MGLSVWILECVDFLISLSEIFKRPKVNSRILKIPPFVVISCRKGKLKSTLTFSSMYWFKKRGERKNLGMGRVQDKQRRLCSNILRL